MSASKIFQWETTTSVAKVFSFSGFFFAGFQTVHLSSNSYVISLLLSHISSHLKFHFHFSEIIRVSSVGIELHNSGNYSAFCIKSVVSAAHLSHALSLGWCQEMLSWWICSLQCLHATRRLVDGAVWGWRKKLVPGVSWLMMAFPNQHKKGGSGGGEGVKWSFFTHLSLGVKTLQGCWTG